MPAVNGLLSTTECGVTKLATLVVGTLLLLEVVRWLTEMHWVLLDKSYVYYTNL